MTLLGPWMERVYQAAVSAIGRALADADVAILDWHMPDMDGLVVITKLKEIDPTIRTLRHMPGNHQFLDQLYCVVDQ